ncbi:MAG: helix-turn-helix domain-containing protein [Candidatus Rifleibacteriota bacterium]
MTIKNILTCEHTRLVERNENFSLYLFSATPEQDLQLEFKSRSLAIFVCLAGRLVSSTQTLSYHLSENLISFALEHDCKKAVPAGVFTEFLVITFTRETLESLIKMAKEDVFLTMSHFTSCQCTVHNCNSDILNLSRKLLKEATEKYWGHELNLGFIFQELLICFIRLFSADKEQAEDQTVTMAKQQLEAALNQDLNLDELADHCGVSKSHLCRVFKKATGQTISQYLNACKIETACNLLGESSFSIEEIAEKAGFNNPSYFFRVFKKQTGKLPLEWRKTYSMANHLKKVKGKTP